MKQLVHPPAPEIATLVSLVRDDHPNRLCEPARAGVAISEIATTYLRKSRDDIRVVVHLSDDPWEVVRDDCPFRLCEEARRADVAISEIATTYLRKSRDDYLCPTAKK